MNNFKLTFTPVSEITSAVLDMHGMPIHVGQVVAQPCLRGNSSYINIRKVTKFENNSVWLDGHKSKCPERLLILGALVGN